MKDFIAELLFHFFIMMIIPLVNNVLTRQNRSYQMDFIFFLTVCLSLSISSFFPVLIADGLAFDFKFIPIFIAFFYIGPRWGILAIAYLLGLSLVNDTNFLSIIINYSSITVLFFIVYKHFIRRTLLFKLVTGVIFNVFIFITRTLYLMQTGAMADLPHLISFSIVSIFTLSTTIYLIEMNKLQLLMMEKLKKADKLNAISQLAASIAHEIRNPMTTIRGFLQLMKNERNITSNQGMFISLSLEELDRTNQIINDFLTLARPDGKFTETISISNLMFDISDFMKPYAVMSNVKMTIEMEDNLHIAGNVNECKQLFINLIKNGIEAMPEGGNLDVTGYKQNRNVFIKIKDNGIGFSPNQLDQLGQPYYSTKSKGTGLGLMISFDIIKRMKGDFEIESVENNGTIFTIAFPIKQ